MYIVKITNNTPLCKMVNFSRSVLKIYTGQKKFTRAAPVAPVTNIRYGVILAHLQLELGESKLHHFPSWCCNRPLAIQFRLVVAIVVEIEAGDCAPALRQVDQPSAALIGSVGETSDGPEAARRDRAISSGQGLITD